MDARPNTMPARKLPRLALATACALALCLVAPSIGPRRAAAVETKSFLVDSAASLQGGKLEGTAVESTGVVVAGIAMQGTSLPEVSAARALWVDKDGTSYVGTADPGHVYRLDGKGAKLFAKTGELMVTALLRGPGGRLVAATVPNGKLLSIDRKGGVKTFATLPSAHIWALAYDSRRKRLFAATGPEGKIYRIDAAGKAAVYFDTEAEHVMSLALAPDGTLFAGTSGDALVLAISAKDKARVVYDFDATEITALSLQGGSLAVAANRFPTKKTPAKGKKKAKTTGQNANGKPSATPKKTSSTASTAGKRGKGQLWLLSVGGQARPLFDSPKGHITAVEWDGPQHVLAATSEEGQVHRVHRDGTQALWLDLDERQVLALNLSGPHPRLSTGDGAAVYRPDDGKDSPRRWTSEALDARFTARWGALSFRGEGAISVQTRSGNTEKPDDNWSDWSSTLTKPGPIRSAPGRFLQLRATLSNDARLFALTAFYLPENQRPIVTRVDVKPNGTAKAGKAPKPTTAYTVSWNVANADGDSLRYRVSYRPEAGTVLRPLQRQDDLLTTTKFVWNTDNVPDGHYVVQVQASDELDNPVGRHATHARLSEPLLVDNHPPSVRDLKVAGGKLTGLAVDSQGPLASLRYRVDQGLWQPVRPLDDILDTAREAFSIQLPKLAKGIHVVAVRAEDTRHNAASAELEFETP